MEATDFGFTRDGTEARAVEKYLNPLPRSITRPSSFELLDGIWRFQLDLEDTGIRELVSRARVYRHRSLALLCRGTDGVIL